MSADAWSTIAFIIVTVVIAVWGWGRRLEDKLTDKSQQFTQKQISDLQGPQLAMEKRIKELEENRHKDMQSLIDRWTAEMRAMEREAHLDRLKVVEALGEVKGSIQLTNQSTDRAHKDIGGINGTLHGLEEKVATLIARQDEKDIETVSGKR